MQNNARELVSPQRALFTELDNCNVETLQRERRERLKIILILNAFGIYMLQENQDAKFKEHFDRQ